MFRISSRVRVAAAVLAAGVAFPALVACSDNGDGKDIEAEPERTRDSTTTTATTPRIQSASGSRWKRGKVASATGAAPLSPAQEMNALCDALIPRPEKRAKAPIGRAFGLCVGAPAGIGVLMVDAAVKSADVDLIGYASPAKGTSFSNEVIGFFSGDAGAVRQAIITAREVGVRLLGTLGSEPACSGVPYI